MKDSKDSDSTQPERNQNEVELEFQRITAGLSEDVMGVIVDDTISSIQTLERVTSELKGIDRVVHGLSVGEDNDRSISLRANGHDGYVNRTLIPQPIGDVYGSSSSGAIKANPNRALDLIGMEIYYLSRRNEKVSKSAEDLKLILPEVADKVPVIECDYFDTIDDSVMPDHKVFIREGTFASDPSRPVRSICVRLDSDEARDGVVGYVEIRTDINGKLFLSVQPDRSRDFKDYRASDCIVALDVSPDGKYTIQMRPAQLHRESGQPGDVLQWTSTYVADFIKKQTERIKTELKI